MTTLEELRRAAPAAPGPDAATLAAERARFVEFMQNDGALASRGRRVPRRALAAAAALLLVGAAAIATQRNGDNKRAVDTGSNASDGSVLTRGMERKTTFDFAEHGLEGGGRIELWATPASPARCIELRRVPAPAVKRHPACFFGQEDRGEPRLTHAVELVDGDTFAYYGRVPKGTDNLVVEFEDSSAVAVSPKRGWYLVVGPSPLVAPPVRVTARGNFRELDVLEPRAPRPVTTDQTAACPTPPGIADARVRVPLTPDEQAYLERNPERRLIMQGRPGPNLSWSLYLSQRRGAAYLSLNHGGADGGGGGHTTSPDKLPLSVSASSLDVTSNAVLGQVDAAATCVVFTDVLGRRIATDQFVSDDRFPGRTFWVIVVPAGVGFGTVDAYDAGGARIAGVWQQATFFDHRI